MCLVERIKMVKAMEYIARQVNNEDVFEQWLLCGVADGDVRYGDLGFTPDDIDDLDYYLTDKNFSYLMKRFLTLMSDAKRNGGLYCDKVISKWRPDDDSHI